MSEAEPHPDRNRRKLYGRRKGPKLSDRQKGLRQTLLGALAWKVGEEPFGQFPNTVKQLWLEVGFGAGEHLVSLAQQRPDVGLIGAEPYEMGMAKILTNLEETPLNTVRLFEGDGREILEGLPDASLSRFFLLFPDPWPKTRHHKRRLIQPPLVALLASRMAPGAILHCATDWLEYAEQMLAVLRAEPTLENTVTDYAPRPEARPQTKFESRGLRLGHGVRDLLFRKRSG